MKLDPTLFQFFKIKKLSLFTALLLLLFALVLRLFFIGGFRSESQYHRDISNNVESALNEVESESEDIRDEIVNMDSLMFSNFDESRAYPYYVFQDGRLLYWSDYRQVPNYKDLRGYYTYQYRNLEGGSFVIRRDTVTHKNDKLEYFILLPIYYENKINNKYISSGYNTNIFPQGAVAVSPKINNKENLISYEGEPIFSVELNKPARGYREHKTAKSFQTLLSVLIIFSIILVLFNVFRSVHYNITKKHYDIAITLVMLSLLGLRFMMLYFEFPYSIMPLRLFDGRFYASSGLNPSLGDLLLNSLSLLLILFYLFLYYRRLILYQQLFLLKPKLISGIVVFLIVAGVYALHIHYYTIKSIYFNSQWTLDITESLDFSSLKIISLAIFVINTVSFFLFAHIIFRTFISLIPRSFLEMKWLVIIAGTLLGTSYLVWSAPTLPIILVSIFYLSLLYTFQFPRYLTRLSYITFLYLFSCALISGITGALAAYDINQVDTLDNKQKFANQLLVDNDVLGEYLLDEVAEKIKEDRFIKNRIYNTLASKEAIRQKINRIYLSNYFDRYDIDIYLFNSRGIPLENADTSNYKQFVKITDDIRFETEYDNIFFINEASDQRISQGAPKRYINLIELEDFNTTIGYIVIDLSLKRFIPNRVYPELLIDRRYLQSYPSNDYDYAIFNGEGELTYSNGDDVPFLNLNGYNFKQNVDNDKTIKRGGFDYLIVKGKVNEYIVIVSETYAFINLVSNFSFLFLLLVFTILIVLGGYSVYFLLKNENLNFATKIQLYLNAAFFMPLLALSITTLSVISKSYSEEVDSEYLKKAEQIGRNIIDILDNYFQGELSDDVLANTLSQMSKYAETDANIFDIEGKLIATSQPLIYEDSLLSSYINPRAIANIKESENNKLVLEESVGSLSYKSSYIGLKSENTGELMGMLSLPFFESRSQLEEQVIQVLTNIMNIFTMVFIVFLIISYLASILLTYPLKYITQKIKRTSLADYNEPLSWDANDEIGLMIGEYNKMLVKLEASKAALARSEKESAWREMAKQVAHEIKNPLTPMKLSLQHLKRKLQVDFKKGMDATEVVEMGKPFDNLLHQIDTLSDIASSFSDFAKMPTPKSEYFDFAALVNKITGLYTEEEGNYISLCVQEGNYAIVSDQQLMGRILSNLIINARQSIPKDRTPKIDIHLQQVGRDKLILKVSDNGTGIAKEIQHKVFLPNFSTKYAGSGIGLAITKRGIEHAGGRIAFDTQEGKGTTFFIELPLAIDQESVSFKE
ncbi:two-component system nitrogen regulation sensor histidine kinase NtrY [Catalinimonas alkaloidigena]|uniref:sensor histidine kinase n=1 Tax=Catalinimonas alkaloidigena TaxID=1075417 RepID=UPI002405F1E8|nr:ATP-binding protein [Catalinimonas alkaloidigena]MDF9796926.1 two-component system nitrogen regulation sensor histidine kinase NtrY [Catalinimonas alkaloidigena]